MQHRMPQLPHPRLNRLQLPHLPQLPPKNPPLPQLQLPQPRHLQSLLQQNLLWHVLLHAPRHRQSPQ